ncbi:sialidase [Psittacine adenovirus 2]|nr:sialidase [Psittacine adenovirus 2]
MIEKRVLMFSAVNLKVKMFELNFGVKFGAFFKSGCFSHVSCGRVRAISEKSGRCSVAIFLSAGKRETGKMDQPWLVTPSRPPWPLKRSLSLSDSINFEAGAGLEFADSVLGVKTDTTLAFKDQRVGVNPDVLKSVRYLPIFKSGDFGSSFFRIPTIISLTNGNVLVFADARFVSRDDFHSTATAVAISDDGGLTFSFKTLALVPESRTPNSRFLDPCIIEAPSGDLFLFVVYFENANHLSELDSNYDFVYSVSRDGGRTWGVPISLKSLSTEEESYFFQCPGQGLVMGDGTLVVPCQSWAPQNELHSTLIYSLDGGKNWKRATGQIPLKTSECQIIEFPAAGNLMLVARKEYAPDTPEGRTRAIYVSKDKGATWEPHRTNGTLRMRNPCSASLIRISPNFEWVALLCGPLADYVSFTQGRSNLVLQYLSSFGTEWVPLGIVDKRVTLGYSGLTFNSIFNRLYVVGEAADGSGVSLYDCTRYLGMINSGIGYNVNLGYEVRVNVNACRLGEQKLRYRRVGSDVWIAGELLPPAGGKFPSAVTNLFDFRLPFATSSRIGWVTCFASKSVPATILFPFILEYFWVTPNLTVRCFANSCSVSEEHKLSDMQIIYFPDSKLATMA